MALIQGLHGNRVVFVLQVNVSGLIIGARVKVLQVHEEM